MKGAANGEFYRVFSEEELHGLKDELAWLKAAERSFEFWDNQEDAVYEGAAHGGVFGPDVIAVISSMYGEHHHTTPR